MIKPIKRILFLAFSLLIVISCKDEETPPPVQTPQDPNYTLNKPKDQIYPFEIVSVDVSGLSDLKAEYEGKFGSVSVKLVKGSGNTLVFIVPDINDGKQTLELSLNSNKKTLDFTVLKMPEIGNPETFFSEMIAASKSQLTDMEKNPGLAGLVSKQREWATAFEQEIAKLSPKEKLETLGVLKINNLYNAISAAASGRLSWECTSENGQVYLNSLSEAAIDQAAIDKLVQAPVNAVSKAAALTAVLNMRFNFIQLKEQALKVLECGILRSIGVDESGTRMLANANEVPVRFESGKDLAIKLFGSYQGLNQTDKTSSIPFVAQLSLGIEKLGEQVDKVIAATNALKNRFSLASANLETGDKLPIPSNPEKEVKPISNTAATVENISTDQVILKQITATNEGASINFESKKGGEQAFNFDLVVEDGPIKVKKTVNASIILNCTLAVEVKVSGGSATLQLTGGLAPFTYTWSNNGSGDSQTGLSPGNYSVKVKDALGCEVTKEFTVQEEPVVGTVKDIDGNEYKTIKIGTQVWMAENLKTSKFLDGTEIPNVTSNTEWENSTTPAYSYYNNDIANNEIYGKLYNWYAATCCAICPEGWHVPTFEDWEKLRVFLLPNAGNKLKSETGWRESEVIGTKGTNESGFTALPGGERAFKGQFSSLGEFGSWWYKKPANASTESIIQLSFQSSIVSHQNFALKWIGVSVRCVKD